MAQRTKVNLLAPNYNKKHMTSGSTQQLVNMYLEQIPAFTGNPGLAAVGTPGLIDYTDLGGSAVRSLIEWQGNGYSISDNMLYKITPNADTPPTVTSLGTIPSSTGRLSVAATTNHILWCDGTAVSMYDGATVTDITATIALGADPIFIVAKDGYILYLTNNENRVYVSDLLDPDSVQALSYFSAQANYDNLVSAAVSDYFVYLFGTIATEIWYTSGGQTVPFDRVPGGVLQFGIAAAHSPAVIAENVYWLAQSDKGLMGIMVANGPTGANVVSTPDFVSKLRGYNSISDAFSTVEVHDGHTFYCLTFPTAEVGQYARGRTWVYDVSNQTMFERQSYNPLTPGQDRHISNCHMYLDGHQVVGDYRSGKLYLSSIDYYDDAGLTKSWVITSPHIIDRDTFISGYNLEADIERGEGLDGDSLGSAPLVSLEISRDKGRTYGRKLIRDVSKEGQYLHRVRWASIGGGRTLTLRLSGSDPIKWVIAGMTMELEGEAIT